MPAKKQSRSSKVSAKNNSLPFVFVIIIFLIGFCTHLVITVIFAETKTDGVIHACANKQNGELRIITNYKDYSDGKNEKIRRDNREDKNGCKENELSLQWNIQGPPGPPGSGQQSGNSVPFVCPACEIFSHAGDRLAGKDMTNAVIPNIEFEGTNLSNSNFTNANMRGANLEQATLTGVNFERTDLTGAAMDGANTEGALWNNTICPDGTNSNDHNNSCKDHLSPAE